EIALEKRRLRAARLCVRGDLLVDVFQRLAAVYALLAPPREIEVDAVEHKYFHDITPCILRRAPSLRRHRACARDRCSLRSTPDRRASARRSPSFCRATPRCAEIRTARAHR